MCTCLCSPFPISVSLGCPQLSAACVIHEVRKYPRISSLKTCLRFYTIRQTFVSPTTKSMILLSQGGGRNLQANKSKRVTGVQPYHKAVDSCIPLAELLGEILYFHVSFSLILVDLQSREPPSDYSCSK